MIYPLLTLCVAIGYMIDGAAAQRAELKSQPIEVHSVIVDMPAVTRLPPPSGEIWDMLESSGQLTLPTPTAQQAARQGDGALGTHGVFPGCERVVGGDTTSLQFPSLR